MPDPIKLRYRSKKHPQLPHIVKFSGGRSSAMLLFTLLDNHLLEPERGDVVIFNNTAAEHPETYRFVAQCKLHCEAAGVPFFLTEFQTYEDARHGDWQRLPSYRLVNERSASTDNPDGYHWRGEVFEEMVSWLGFLPNRFRRVCTKHLKLETTRKFLADWLAAKDGIPHQGHGQSQSLTDPERLYQRYIQNGGSVPKNILLAKKQYALGRPTSRPKQRYQDFSQPAKPFDNPALRGKVFGGRAALGHQGAEYLAFIGLRADEQMRVHRVHSRAANPQANAGYEGEHVCTPLVDLGIRRADVNAYWKQRDFDLGLPDDGGLSNCVYCFLKGPALLNRIRATMPTPVAGTPSDLGWWQRLERRYGRDLANESGQRVNPDSPAFIGFFGAAPTPSYDTITLAADDCADPFQDTLLPCDCTD